MILQHILAFFLTGLVSGALLLIRTSTSDGLRKMTRTDWLVFSALCAGAGLYGLTLHAVVILVARWAGW